MTWPELYEAKKKAHEIANEIDKLLKEHNSLMKNEISQHSEKLLNETDDITELIKEKTKKLEKSLNNHRKQLEAKSRFLKRHYNRI